MKCGVTECPKPARNSGLCWGHYARRRKYGNPTAGFCGPADTARQRIERFTDRTGECWLWTAATNRAGYGLLGIPGRSTLAHRIAYEEYVGPVPDGLELDHLCRVRRCVKPAHLEPVTRSENVRRGWPFRADYRGARS